MKKGRKEQLKAAKRAVKKARQKHDPNRWEQKKKAKKNK